MPIASTFGQRFEFARAQQAVNGRKETDTDFAEAVGVGSSAVTGYKSAINAPPAERVLVIAKRCGVDPGWLAFGEDTNATAPVGFAGWLVGQPKLKKRLRAKRGKRAATGRVEAQK